MRPRIMTLALASALCAPAIWAKDPAESVLPAMTVTGTREGELLSETPATVEIINDQTLRETRPTHPKGTSGSSRAQRHSSQSEA